MNDAQTVFALFYGFYFAAKITLTVTFRGFDTPAMYDGEGRAWLRFIASFILLNIVPLMYFVTVFEWLSKAESFSVDFWSMLKVLVLSMAGFGFYRIYFGTMLAQRNGQYFFYGAELPPRLADEMSQRSARQGEVLPHIVPGIVWVVICLLAAWFLR